MTDLAVEQQHQSPSMYGTAPPISDEAMEAKRKALEILVAPAERGRIPVPNHLLQSSETSHVHWTSLVQARSFLFFQNFLSSWNETNLSKSLPMKSILTASNWIKLIFVSFMSSTVHQTCYALTFSHHKHLRFKSSTRNLNDWYQAFPFTSKSISSQPNGNTITMPYVFTRQSEISIWSFPFMPIRSSYWTEFCPVPINLPTHPSDKCM